MVSAISVFMIFPQVSQADVRTLQLRGISYVNLSSITFPSVKFLYTPGRHIWGVDLEIYSLTLALDEGEWSASRSGCFNSVVDLPVTN